MVEGNRLDPPVPVGEGHDGVAGAEIDADRKGRWEGADMEDLVAVGGGPHVLYAQSWKPSKIACRRGTPVARSPR